MISKEKILININNLEEINKYKEIGIANFLFAVKNLSIGYSSFAIKDIPDNSFLFMNRLLDKEGIEYFKSIIPELKRFKGIIFEDIGIFNLLKDDDYNLIWFQNHFTTNYNSINFYLDNGASSAVISNEITKEEIDEILNKTTKPLVLTILAKNNIMYSRRSLLTNYNKHFNLDNYNDMVLKTKNNSFLARESEYGTVIFNNEYFNYIDYANTLDSKNINYYLIMNLDLSVSDINDIINGKKFGNDGFLNKKTYYKMEFYDDKKGAKS